MIRFRKYSKVLLFSILSLLAYSFIEYSDKISAITLLIRESKSSHALGYFILFNIGKWFLLTFGSLGLCFFSFKILIKKD
jgi:hypothetical protein